MKSMDTIAGSATGEHFDVPLETLFDYKLSGEKELVDTLVQDWPFLDDLDSEKYLQSPLSGDMLPVDCVGINAIQDSELLGNLDDAVPMDTDLSKAGNRSPSCKSCTSDTDSQYDSGVGESLSGEDSECSVLSGHSTKSPECSTSSGHITKSTDCSMSSGQITKSPECSMSSGHIAKSPECSMSSGHSTTSPEKTPVPSPQTVHTSSCVTDMCVKSETETEVNTPNRRQSRRYNLRTSSVINRVETEQKTRKPRQTKPKTRPPPLSKYRRKTANARERGRMTEINEAFQELQEVLPELPDSKQTKITTLRLAMNYISALRELLASEESQLEGENSSSGSPVQAQAGPVHQPL